MSATTENVSDHKYYSVNKLYSEQYDLPLRDVEPIRRLLIASIPRSGSTNLCINLWRSGAFGAPLEYYNLHNRKNDMLHRIGDSDPFRYLVNLPRLRCSPNGVFSAKAFISDLRQLEEADPRLLAEVHATTTLYFTRENKLGQAISYARARQTGKWFSSAGQLTSPEYSYDLIQMALGWIFDQELAWERIFVKTRCQPLRLSYERFLADPEGSTSMIARALGVTLSDAAAIEVPGIDVQRDAISADWQARFLADSTAMESRAVK